MRIFTFVRTAKNRSQIMLLADGWPRQERARRKINLRTCSGYIKIVFEPFEEEVDLRVRNCPGSPRELDLLGNVCDIGALSVFREEMVKWLFFSGVSLREHSHHSSVLANSVDVENHTSERVYAMLDDLSDLEFAVRISMDF